MRRPSSVRLLLALVALTACGRAADGLVLVGTVERTLMEIVAPVSETLVDVSVRRGAAVRRGEVVARLDPTLARADAAHEEAALVAARAALAMAELDLGRIARLHRSNIATPQDLERAQLAREETAARMREAEARLAAARHRLEELTLTSPVDGIVDQIPFDPGERVPMGGVVIVVLDGATPWVRVWLPEGRVAQVRPGTSARIRVDGVPAVYAGGVLDVSREPEFTPHFALTERDRVHLVYETRVAIDDAPADLRPGVPAEVTLLPAGAESG
jgi:HlyD family secretion protein